MSSGPKEGAIITTTDKFIAEFLLVSLEEAVFLGIFKRVLSYRAAVTVARIRRFREYP